MEVSLLHIQIEQNQLSALLGRVIKAVEKKNTIPLLGSFLLTAKDGELSVYGTDLEVEVISRASCNVIEDGGTTVDASLFLNMIKGIDKGDLVELKQDGFRLHVNSTGVSLKLTTLPVEDFPRIASNVYTHKFNCSADDIARLIKKTSFATSAEQTRYYLNGVHLHTNDGFIRAVATDGHRLAVADSDIKGVIPPVIIPNKSVGVISDNMALAGEGNMSVEVSDTKVRICDGVTTITTVVIDGVFPDYKRIIPDYLNNKVTFNAETAAKAIGHVSQAATDRTRVVRFEVADSSVSMAVIDPRNGDARREVPASLDGDPVVIGLNGKYALDCMALGGGGNVIVRFGTPMEPILVKYDNDEKFLAVVMPTRI